MFYSCCFNHSEGFHHQLKEISKKNLGIEYNLTKLIEQINKKYEKDISGLDNRNKLNAQSKKHSNI